MGDLMRLGGAGAIGPDALDLELERLAASIGSSMGAEFGAFSFNCLSTDFGRVFGLFSDVLLRPRFDSDKISLWKGQTIEGIRRRIEDPSTVASIAFAQLLYGPTPYGRVTNEPDVARVSRAQLFQLHQEFIRPNEAILVITGRIEREDLEKAVDAQLSKWAPREEALPPAPAVAYTPEPGIYFVELPFSQATVRIGHLGVPRLTPDYPEIDVFNEVFGASGFGARLMKRVRTELGLSYGTYGGISPGVSQGINHISLQTKAPSVGLAIKESISVLTGLQREPPTVEELVEKKAGIRNSFVFNFDTSDDIAGRLARLRLLRYPENYDETYLPKVDAVTPDGVQQVAQSRWDPSKFVVVVVGNETAYANLEQAVSMLPEPLNKMSIRKLRFETALVVQ
jgi:zinc protease